MSKVDKRLWWIPVVLTLIGVILLFSDSSEIKSPAPNAATPKTFTWVKVAEIEAPEKWGPEFLAPISISGIFRWVAKEGEAEVRCSNGFYIVLGASVQRDESGQSASGMCRARSSDKPTKVSVYTPQT